MAISKQPKPQLDFEIDGVRIKQVQDLKLLGVVIDQDLNFLQHISTLCKKASMRVEVLMRLRKLIPVKAAILPFLTILGILWHFSKESDSNKIERINECGLRANIL